MNMEKVIFLDIDGVMNSQKWFIKSHKKYKYYCNQYHWDKMAVNRLNHIIYKTDAKIVISSTWRYGKSVEWFNWLFNQIKLNGLVIGMTKRFHHYKFEVPRGVEIKQYYSDHYNHPSYFEDVPSRLYSYVILDDFEDMLYEQRNNFIRTDDRFGLTDDLVPKIISILNTEIKPNYIKEL